MSVDFTKKPNNSDFGNLLGFEITEYDRENLLAAVEVKFEKRHTSVMGNVHGGCIAGLFDTVCGLTTFTTLENGDSCSTIELKINYLLPMKVGDHVKCVGRIAHQGKRICVIQSEIRKTSDDSLLALATATFNVVRAKTASL